MQCAQVNAKLPIGHRSRLTFRDSPTLALADVSGLGLAQFFCRQREITPRMGDRCEAVQADGFNPSSRAYAVEEPQALRMQFHSLIMQQPPISVIPPTVAYGRKGLSHGFQPRRFI